MDGELFVRELGTGAAIVVVHGGPDFDHTYLRPELDRLAASFRLIFYDQRGRGRSVPDVRPSAVSLESELADLDTVIDGIGAGPVAILGHSWGGVLASEYATTRAERVSHLVLMNCAPLSQADHEVFRRYLLTIRSAEHVRRMAEIVAGDDYRRGGIAAELDYYRMHFRATVRRDEDLEVIVGRLRTHFTPASVLNARAIEQRLYAQTWRTPGYDLAPRLRELDLPSLIIHAEHDLIPIEVAQRIAGAVPGAILTVLDDCGHFAYVERPEVVVEEVGAFVGVG